MRVRFDGLDVLQGALLRAAEESPRKARGALGRGVDAVRDQAKQAAGAKWTKTATGASQESIRARMGRGGVEAYVIMDGRGGYFQERGTYKDPPNPVVGPAFEAVVPSIIDELGEVMGDV